MEDEPDRQGPPDDPGTYFGEADFGQDPIIRQESCDTPKQDEIITNEQGGKQSKIAGKMTEVPPMALLEISKVMGKGSEVYLREKDGTPNWHKIDSMSNLDHSLRHATKFLIARNSGVKINDYTLDELSHFAARAMMALEMFMIEGRNEK